MALPQRFVEKEFCTEAEYLAWERDAPYKSEYVNGQIIPLNGECRTTSSAGMGMSAKQIAKCVQELIARAEMENGAIMSDLTFNSLPDLPQVATLKQIAASLWQRNDVVALWLGGSFARGEADEFSDVDLRVAVTDGSLDAWSVDAPSFLLGETVVGVHSMSWDRIVLHHLVLENGVILDLLVQSTSKELPQDFTRVLGCRDTSFGELLDQACLSPTEEPGSANPAIIRQTVNDFWIGSHKHSKVLSRGLDMLVLVGLGTEQSVLMRLWYVAATGHDQATQRGTIHTLTQMVRTVMGATGSHGLETLGTARGSRADILHTIELNRDEVSRVGKELSEALGFEYPEVLERTVRQAWRQYLHGAEAKRTG